LDGYEQDGVAAGIGFGHHGRGINVLREVPLGLAHLVAHVVGSLFEVDAKVEFHGDIAVAQGRGTGDGPDARDAVDGAFERLSDLTFNDFRIGARVVGAHRDVGRVDGGVLAHAQKSVAHNTKKHDEDAHHGGENRAAEGKIG
jgi:hypothetical protein